MIKLGIGLRFPGTAEAAFDFYKSVFGGEFVSVQRLKEILNEGDNSHQVDENAITFIGLPVGKEDLLTGDDQQASGVSASLTQGNNVIIGVISDSKIEGDRIFGAVSAGGRVETPLSEQFWGGYYGFLLDKFGVWWSVECRVRKS